MNRIARTTISTTVAVFALSGLITSGAQAGARRTSVRSGMPPLSAGGVRLERPAPTCCKPANRTRTPSWTTRRALPPVGGGRRQGGDRTLPQACSYGKK